MFLGVIFLAGMGILLVVSIIFYIKTPKEQKIPKMQELKKVQKEEIKPISPPVKKLYKKYICNNKTLVFHRPKCSYIKCMDLEDICYSDDYVAYDSDFKYSRLIEIGYKPCKRCKPR